MDLGRNYCKSRKAFCDLCPVSSNCMAKKQGRQLEVPIIEELQKTQMYNLDLLRVIVQKGNRVLAYKKSKKEWLQGQYELPTYTLYSEDDNCNQYPIISASSFHFLDSFKSFITKYKIINYVLLIDAKDMNKLEIEEDSFEWIDYKSKAANLSTASMKSLNIY
jgi:adenine-specific DNA glycosylase